MLMHVKWCKILFIIAIIYFLEFAFNKSIELKYDGNFALRNGWNSGVVVTLKFFLILSSTLIFSLHVELAMFDFRKEFGIDFSVI